jgi:4-amino-4-deoxy-L-arabinose transferase-like glycosyltransferase
VAGKLRPERAVYGVAALAGLIALWNALAYPPGAGYDAASHKEYADFLIQHHRLPFRNETPEYYSPPLYYALAGSATWVGRQIGLGEPHKLGQLLNVPVVVATVLLVAALARLLWPSRRWAAPAAAGFVALSPVLVRTAAMFHPEPTDLLVSVLCAYLAARILIRRRYRTWAAVGLGAALGAGEMIRQFALYTLAVVGIVWVAAMWERTEERRALVRTGLIAAVACIVVAGPWYAYRIHHYANPVFDRQHSSKPLFERRPARFYVDPGLPGAFTHPYRPHLANLALPETYSDIWGDWYGVFAWSIEQHGKPARAQNVIGIVPTLLALGGWLALLVTGVRRRSPSLLLVSLMPLGALAGYFYFAIAYPTPDGDVLKPNFMLSALWAWALCFAWAATRLPRRAVAVLVALAVLDVPFLVYKGSGGLF